MDDCRRDPFDGRRLEENKTLVEHASVQRSLVDRKSIWEQMHPDPVEIVDDAGIVKRIPVLDQAERILDAA
jgi:hypothetical protein